MLGERCAKVLCCLTLRIDGYGAKRARRRKRIVLGYAIATMDGTPEDKNEKDDGTEASNGHATEAFIQHQSPAGGGPA